MAKNRSAAYLERARCDGRSSRLLAGIGWYRKHFTVDRRYAGQRVFLEFEGANQVAEFWLNGARLGIHNNGYTGFEFDVTAQLRFGEDNVLRRRWTICTTPPFRPP